MIEYLAPNEKTLEIIRLHLERLPMMTDEERRVFLDVARRLIWVPLIVHAPIDLDKAANIANDTGRPVFTTP